MKRVYLLLLVPLLLIPVRTAAQYEIPHGTFSCGGDVRSGTNFVYDTSGQSAADRLSGTSYGVKLGFWYLADLNSAVDVAITSFEGRCTEDAVELSWRAEIDTPFDGFDLYRAEGDEEKFMLLNSERIEAVKEALYTDRTAFPGRSYRYYLIAVKDGSELFRSPTVKLELPPKPVTLYQNFPNPFNPSTTISFFIPERTVLRLDIFNVRGRRVTTLADGIYPAAGYDLEWNGRDSRGRPVSSGVYYYRLEVSRKSITKKLVLMR